MAAITPGELRAASVGSNKQREGWYELGLFVAWHMAVFNSQAKAGKLKAWSEILATLTGKTETPVDKDWRTRKAERAAQMAQHKKHEAQRRRPLKRLHGR